MSRSDHVPLAYLNGRILPAPEAGIPLHDAGFVWGATVTDRVRTYRHKLYRLSEHLERFRSSCELCSIPQPVSDEELARIAERLMALNSAMFSARSELALIMFATPGACRPGKPAAEPTLGMHAVRLEPEAYQRLLTHGARLVIPDALQLPPDCVPRQAKMRSRMHWWLAEEKVRESDPDAMALLRDRAGHITETSAANFLIVRKGIVLSPPRAQILDGVSLLVVEELCGVLGIQFEERSLRVDDCLAADEALLTSTPYGIAGVSRINDRDLKWPSPVLKRLHDLWSHQIGQNIWFPILPDR